MSVYRKNIQHGVRTSELQKNTLLVIWFLIQLCSFSWFYFYFKPPFSLSLISGSLPASASNTRLLVETKIHLLRAGLWQEILSSGSRVVAVHSVARKIRRNKKWCKMLPRFCLLQFLYENKMLICLLLLFFVQSALCSHV